MKLRILTLIIFCFVCAIARGQGKFGGGVGDGYATESFSATVVSIKIELETELRVYPNPVKDVIYLENEKMNHADLALRDSQGRVLLKLNRVPSEIRIDHLSPGIYYLRVGKIVRKVVKV